MPADLLLPRAVMDADDAADMPLERTGVIAAVASLAALEAELAAVLEMFVTQILY